MRAILHTVVLALVVYRHCVAAEGTPKPQKGSLVQQTHGQDIPNESQASKQDIDDVRRRIASNPDAAVDMSHLKSLAPELAAVLICEDEVVRPVRRTREVRYTLVTETVPGKKPKRYSTKSKSVEYTVHAPGRALYLNGLENLSEEAAELLGRHRGDLQLNGLRELDSVVAAALSGHIGLLSLDGLEKPREGEAYVDLEDLLTHNGPVSLRGLKRLERWDYQRLMTPWIYGIEHSDGCRLLLPREIIVEESATVMPVVRWSQMPGEDTVANYVRRISEQVDVHVEVDEAALQRLKVDALVKVSAPVGRVLRTDVSGQRLTMRVVPEEMNLDEAVAWLAREMNSHTPKDATEEVIAFMTGENVLLTVHPVNERPAPTQCALPTGEITEGYRCDVSDWVMRLHQGDGEWPDVGKGMVGLGGGAF